MFSYSVSFHYLISLTEHDDRGFLQLLVHLRTRLEAYLRKLFHFQIDLRFAIIIDAVGIVGSAENVIQVNKQLPDCRFTASVRPEAIAPLGKRRFTHRAYDLHNSLLNHSVHHGWDCELPYSACVFIGTDSLVGIILNLLLPQAD